MRIHSHGVSQKGGRDVVHQSCSGHYCVIMDPLPLSNVQGQGQTFNGVSLSGMDR